MKKMSMAGKSPVQYPALTKMGKEKPMKATPKRKVTG